MLHYVATFLDAPAFAWSMKHKVKFDVALPVLEWIALTRACSLAPFLLWQAMISPSADYTPLMLPLAGAKSKK